MAQTLFSGLAKLVGLESDAESISSGRFLRTECLSGVTVALALVPEAVAFAFVAGVAPMVGLHAAFIVGLITALFGGRPGMISGATGALAVVMVSLVASHGVEYLFATVILMGILQLLAGIFRLGKFIRMVPHPVMLGFVNGLAIVIGLAQLEQFRITAADGSVGWMGGTVLYTTLALVGVTMLIIWGMPKLTRAIPAPLAAIGVVTALVMGFGLDVPKVADLADIAGDLPIFAIPNVPLSWETLKIILPYAVILAAIGLIESLLTLNLVGDLLKKRGGASQECLAQGGANLVTGFFGGMGGCAMIGQSMINVKSGGRSRIAGVVAALSLLIFILFGADIIGLIPLAALIGVMFMVVIGTFAWHSLQIMRHAPRADSFVIILVTVVTVAQDLAVAVVVGVIVSALVYAWNASKRITASKRASIQTQGALVYDIHGPLFFASATHFRELFQVSDDPDTIIIDFKDSRIVDQSALQAIADVAKNYNTVGKRVILRGISPDCQRLLQRSDLIVIASSDDPEYGLAVDYTIQHNGL